MARMNGDPQGIFDSLHVRRNDFQVFYKDTQADGEKITARANGLLEENSTVYVATDESNVTFFDPLRKHYHIYFLNDFKHLIKGISFHYYGMIDQLVASRGRTFVGSYYSTFSGYINRVRGYHSQKEKLAGHEKGEINSYYYVDLSHRNVMRQYRSPNWLLWAQEFPIGWRDIDHDVKSQEIIS